MPMIAVTAIIAINVHQIPNHININELNSYIVGHKIVITL